MAKKDSDLFHEYLERETRISKNKVLEILSSNIIYDVDKNGFKFEFIPTKVIEQIEKM